MFNVGITGMGQNGFMNMIMQSDEDTQRAIAEFDKRISELGYMAPPALVFKDVLDDLGIREKDLTYADKERIKRKIESVSTGGLNYD